LAWAYRRENAISKERGKGFLKILSGKGRGHFSAKKCSMKCAKKTMPEAKAEKGLIMQINANNLYQRKLL
jgi:hypothetical protein